MPAPSRPPAASLRPRDADLIAGARAGRPDALAALYERHAAMVLATAYRFTTSRADAEDVLHDVFLGLPERLAAYEERGQFGEWLRRVAVRAALAQLRVARRRGEVPLGAGEPPTPATAVGPPATIDARDVLLGDVLARAVAALGDSLRVVFLLKAIEGYSHAEIAALLGIREGASAVRFHRAVRALRGALAGRL